MLACESRMKGHETPIHAADAKFALDYLLSEIAALRGEVQNGHEHLEFEVHRADQAERQRDEAFGLLRDTVQPSGLYDTGGASIAEKLNAICAFLANQGADQCL
jgi:hypothetical protein